MQKGYEVKLLDNSLGEGKGSLLSLDKLNNIVYPKDIRSQILKRAEELLESKTITPEQYEKLIK